MSKENSQVITCKAIVSWGAGEALRVEEIQVDPPKSSEVRVKMLCASLCHTDILSTKGFPRPLFPRVMGHEGVGVVESIGEEVNGQKQGDIVIPTYVAECQTCENCTSGKTNLCLKIPDANYVFKVDPSISRSHASFLSCGYSTGFGAAWKEAKVEEGSTVAVFGLGTVGLGVVEGARIQGASKIIGIDKNPRKKEKGQVFGMTDFINPDDSDKSICEAVQDLTDGKGVDYSFECTGVAPLLNEAIESTKRV
ncbi:hypothetical protein PTKIN_Ptkin01aG0400800 [Pterospermum kingtungense]